jgi:hypothetical protein
MGVLISTPTFHIYVPIWATYCVTNLQALLSNVFEFPASREKRDLVLFFWELVKLQSDVYRTTVCHFESDKAFLMPVFYVAQYFICHLVSQRERKKIEPKINKH